MIKPIIIGLTVLFSVLMPAPIEVKKNAPQPVVKQTAIVNKVEEKKPVEAPVIPEPVKEVTQTPPPVQATPPPKPASVGTGSCSDEIAKYAWDTNVANAVMMAESGGNAARINNNPATGDYSVGCFQVNLYGSNALSRPSEAELVNADVNVRWAYEHWLALGGTFGTSGGWGAYNNGSYARYLQ